MPQYVYSPDDQVNPVFCTGCRLHIPRAISTAGNGLCPSCLGATPGGSRPTTQLVMPPAIRWGDALFATIAIVDVLRSISTFVPAMFVAFLADGMARTNYQTVAQVQGSPQSEKIIALLFLGQLAYSLLTCGAVGTLLGMKWGYLTSFGVSVLLVLVLVIQIVTSQNMALKSQMVFSLMVYASICCYSIVQLSTRRYRA